VLKGLPSTYDKDMQEDRPLFDAADTIELTLVVAAGAIEARASTTSACAALDRPCWRPTWPTTWWRAVCRSAGAPRRRRAGAQAESGAATLGAAARHLYIRPPAWRRCAGGVRLRALGAARVAGRPRRMPFAADRGGACLGKYRFSFFILWTEDQ
jgi:hypothetical protein